eukprot:SAG11_NODE_27982_length_326_cov_1.537445_1_plen_25_part_01
MAAVVATVAADSANKFHTKIQNPLH